MCINLCMLFRKSADMSPCTEILETVRFADLLRSAATATDILAASHNIPNDNFPISNNKNEIHSSTATVGGDGGNNQVLDIKGSQANNNINSENSISNSLINNDNNNSYNDSMKNALNEIWSENLCRHHQHHRNRSHHQSSISPSFIKTLSERMEQSMNGHIPLYVQHHH